MKLPTTSALMLFLNSASAKITGGDDHMMRNILAKVEAQDAKIANLEALHDKLNEKNAKLEALLMGAPHVSQGKKELCRRGLLREEDANLADAATTIWRKRQMIPLLY